MIKLRSLQYSALYKYMIIKVTIALQFRFWDIDSVEEDVPCEFWNFIKGQIVLWKDNQTSTPRLILTM